MSSEQETLLPVTAVRESDEDVSAYTKPSYAQQIGLGIAMIALNGSAILLWSNILTFKTQRAWRDIPNPGVVKDPMDTFFAIYVVLTMWSIFAFLSFFILEPSAWGHTIKNKIMMRTAKERYEGFEARLFRAVIFATLLIPLVWYCAEPETCSDDELRTVLHIPHAKVLPITAEVAFPRSATTLTFAFARNELGIAHENNTLRIAYDFDSGLALPNANASEVPNVRATFSDASMQLSLPPPRDDLLFVPDASGDVVRDASLFGAGESIIRFLDRPKGHVCLAKFDRASPPEVARIAFPLGIVMHSAHMKNLWPVAV